MTIMYSIQIDAGVISFDSEKVTSSSIEANKHHAINAKQYFLGKDKPKPISVRGWPFSKMYLIRGTDSSGQAVAWA